MAHCPACSKKLRLINVKPDCPHCGVNLNYYKANEILLEESEKSEIEHAKFQPKVDRGKAATIGTATGKIRMAFFLIPIAAIFLPLFSVTAGGTKKNYNAISIFNLSSSLDTGALFGNISPLLIAVILIALPAVCCIVFTVLQLTAGTKKGLKRNVVYSSVFLTLSVSALVCLCVFANSPAKTYTDIILNEAEFALKNGGQSDIDEAVKKIKNIDGDLTVDSSILERAVRDGKDTLANAGLYGLTAEETAELSEKVADGEKLLSGEISDIDEVRNHASAINDAVYRYSPLQTSIYSAINDALNREDAVYSDECLSSLKTETENAILCLKNTVKKAKLIENNGIYSENSFNSLQSAIENAEKHIETYNNGELLVELEDDDGSGNKTEKELAQETAETVQNDYNGLNNAVKGLTDISVLSTLIPYAEDGAFTKTAENNVTASVGIGIILFIILYTAQLIFNIYINKKGFTVKYTECLIGGMPSEEYFELVKQGLSTAEIRRKMLVVLARQQDEYNKKLAEDEEKARNEKLKEIKGAK